MSIAVVCGALVFGASGCGGDNKQTATGGGAAQQKLSGSIAGAGSSAQAAAMEAWIAGFQQQNPDATVSGLR